MVKLEWTYVLLLCCVLYTNCEVTPLQNAELATNKYSSQISAVIDYISKIYRYQFKSLQYVQQKGDITELRVLVDLICTPELKNVPCTPKTFSCDSFVRYNEDDKTSRVLGNIRCNPVETTTENVEDEPYMPETSEVMFDNADPQMVHLSHETVTAMSGEQFVAIRRDTAPCIGCPIDLALDHDIRGIGTLIDTALLHIESERERKYTFIKVLRLQQQVEYGVKYILLLEVAPTSCFKNVDYSEGHFCSIEMSEDEHILTCQVTYLEKPWISLNKDIISNNCTVNQNFFAAELPDSHATNRDDINNDIDVNNKYEKHMPGEKDILDNTPNFDRIAETGSLEEVMNPSRLADLESQIIVEPINAEKSNKHIQNIPTQNTVSSVPTFIAEIAATEDNPNIAIIGNTEQVPQKTLDGFHLQENSANVGTSRTSDTIPSSNDNSESIPEDQTTTLETDASASTNLFGVFSQSETYPEDVSRLSLTLGDEFATVENNNSQEDNLEGDFNTGRQNLHKMLNDASVLSQENKRENNNQSIDSLEHKLARRSPDDSSSSSSSSSSSDSDSDSDDDDDDNSSGKKCHTKKCKDDNNDDDSNDSDQKSHRKKSCGHSRHKPSHDNDNDDSNDDDDDDSDESDEKPHVKKSCGRSRHKSCDDNDDDDNDDDDSDDSNDSNDSDEKRHKKKHHGRSRHKSCDNNDDDDSDDDDDSNDSNEKCHKKSANHSKQTSSNDDSDDDDDDNNKENRVRRSIGRLEKIAPEEKPLVRDLADFAAATLDNIDDDNHKRVVLQIVSAKKMNSKGTYYHLILRLGISHCFEDKHPGITEECREKLFENLTKICKVQVHVTEDQNNAKVIKSQCQNTKRDENDKNRTNYSRYKREDKVDDMARKTKRQVMPGGIAPQSKDDPTIFEYLNEGLEHIDRKSSNANKLKVKEVLSASRQVVSGSLWHIEAKLTLSDCLKNLDKNRQECGELKGAEEQKCNFKIWDRPWLTNGREITVDCGEGKEVYTSKRRRKRSLESIEQGIPGGINEEPIDSPEVLEYLNNGLKYLDQESTYENKHKVREVLSASRQIVEGELWRIKTKIIISDCLKNSEKKREECGELEGAEEKECYFEIWDRPWLPNGRQTTVNCGEGDKVYKARRRRSTENDVPGGITKVPVDDPEALKYLNEGLDYLDQSDSHENKHKVREVVSVSKQIVSGTIWRIKTKVILSDCSKNSITKREECGELNGAEEKQCNFEIWNRPWLPNGRQTTVDCGEGDEVYISKRRRRRSSEAKSLVGGITEQPVDDPKTLEYLNEGLEFIDQDSSHENKHKVREVVSASSQVVSGALWRIKSKIILSDCSKNSNKRREECGELEGAEEKECNFKIWDRAWLPNGRQTTVNCGEGEKVYTSKRRRRRSTETKQVPGGITEQPVSDSRVLEYVNQGLDYIDQDSSHENKHKVREVVSASSQVVSGILWRIQSKIILSDCSKNSNKRREECGELEGAEEKECDIKIWDRPWLPNGRETTINCGEGEKVYTSKRRRRRSTETKQVPGGITEQPVSDSRVLEYVNQGLDYIDQDSSHENKHKVREVVSASSQVVSGTLWRIQSKIILSDCSKNSNKRREECGELEGAEEKECDIKIWDRPWLPNGRETTINCGEGEKVYTSKRRRRRSTETKQVPGGITEQPVSDSRVLEYVNQGLDYIDQDSSHENKHKVREVVSASSQVVSGTLWRIRSKIILSDCSKNSNKRREECGELEGAEEKECDIKIWDRPWLPNGRETTINCGEGEKVYTSKRRRRRSTETKQVPGGITEQPVSDSRVLEYVNQGLDYIDQDSSHENKHKVREVVSASSQVVSGILWRIQSKIILSDCSKNSNKRREECGELEGAEEEECDIKIWDRPWLPNGLETTINCGEGEKVYTSKRRRRRSTETKQVPGGITEQPVSDSRVLEYVNQGLDYIDQDSSHENKHKVREVVSASSQVVSGTLWRIRSKIILSDCSKNSNKRREECGELEGAEEKECDIKIWDRPWLPNGRETTINCGEGEKVYTSKRRRRRSTETKQVPGGKTEQPVSDSRVLEYVNQGLDYIDQDSSQENKHKVREVVSASSQVVSGTLWRIQSKIILSDCSKNSNKTREECGELEGAEEKECDIKIWDRPWLPNGRQTTINCGEGEKVYTSKRRRRRSTETKQVRGGITEQPVSDSRVLEYVNQGLDYIDQDSSHENKHKVREVVSASSQVVSGALWRIKSKIILSDCSKNSNKRREECGELEGAEEKECDIKIWDRPWLPNGRQTTINCGEGEKVYTSKRRRRRSTETKQVPGGITEQPVSDSRVLEYVNQGLDYIDQDSSQENKHKVREVVSASSQVVSGTLWHIQSKIILSDCSKNSNKRREECGELEGAEEKECDIKIWDRPWLPNGRQTTVNCGEGEKVYTSKRRRRRDLAAKRRANYYQQSMFNYFINKYDKIYDTTEDYQYRYKVFRDNLDFISLLNLHEQGTAEYGVTLFADLTREEFSKYKGYRQDLRNENSIPLTRAEIPSIELPESFDWREKGAVSEVKNQGMCGSCWAFSVTGNVEGQYAIKHGKILEFSEQELVDCDTVDNGCNGGLMDNAYKVIEQLGGLETEGDYPYEGENEKCHFNKSLVHVELTGALNISSNETNMAKWLVGNGPISIAINANAMQFYMGGVSHPYKFLCNPKNLDHGVLIVGYGIHKYPLFKKTLPYWIVKNSWGPSWGESGYYRVYRGDGTCGLNQTPSSAIVE